MRESLRGRPRVGPAVQVRFPRALLDGITRQAEREGMKRAAWIREACAEKLTRDLRAEEQAGG